MAEAVASQLAEQLANAAKSSSATEGLMPGVDAATASAWQNAYAAAGQPSAAPGAVEGVPKAQGLASEVSPTPTVAPQEGIQPASQALFDPAMNQSVKGMTPGDRIINGLKTTSDNLTQRLESVAQLVSQNGGDMSLATALHVQVEVTKFGIEAELTSKIISKSTQDLDQLTRMQ